MPNDASWTWLSRSLVEALHAESLRRFGGTPRLRDEDLLESALARPRHLERYDTPTVFDLAAAYAEGLIRNHPFVDGNKRVGLLAARAFLFQNGYNFDPDPDETISVIESCAAGAVSREELSDWLAAGSVPRDTTS